MKKGSSIAAVLLCIALLAGCRTVVPGEHFDVGHELSKAQKIVIQDAAGNEKAVLSTESEIDAFVEVVNVGGWNFIKEVPGGLTEAGRFTLWQRETITALAGEGETEENEICTFRIYENGDYLTIEAWVIDMTFSIPRETADYLRGLTA